MAGTEYGIKIPEYDSGAATGLPGAGGRNTPACKVA